MKKIFYGSTYILMLVMMFTYMLIEQDLEGDYYCVSLLTHLSGTGVSVIGFLFTLPALIFSIIAMCISKKGIIFSRDIFSFFAGIFCIATGIIGLFTFKPFYYVPIILLVASAVIFVLALVNITKTIKEEGKQAEQK